MRLTRLNFSLSTHIALIVAAVVLAASFFIGFYAISAANEVLRRDAIASLGEAADVRLQLLVSRLAATRTRTRSILQMSDGICSVGRGDMRSCLSGVFNHFLRATEASGVQFYPKNGQPIFVGLGPENFNGIVLPTTNELARIGRGVDHRVYVQVRAQTDSGELRAQFPIKQLEGIFSARDGLGRTGEAFLTDAAGFFLTSTDYHGAIGHSQPILATPIVRCLKGASGETLGLDFRDIEKVHAFRPVAEIGGGCVMVNIGEAEAFAKSAELVNDVVKIALITMAVSVLLALLAARRMTKPIRGLAERARALENGDYSGQPVVRGPREIQTFALAFSRMTQSLLAEISERKSAEVELSRAIRSRDEFLATLSHELRTPMNIILGWIEILKADGFDPKVFAQATETLSRNALLQKNLIDDLLDVSRIINGKFEVAFETVDFGSVVKNCCEALMPAAKAKGVSVRLEIPETSIWLKADPLKLSQVVTNIFQNALKFTNQGGKIEVGIFSDTRFVRLEVHDNGIGIDAAFLPHVFERLKQEDMATTRSHSGLGLGLAICRHIVEQHQGAIRATSGGRGQGSTFIVELPVEEQPLLAEPTVNQMPPKGGVLTATKSNGRQVLIVDDSPDILILLRAWLEQAGYIVSEAENASDALRILQSVKPDLLISDIGLPGEDGYHLINRIRCLTDDLANIPAIAITAYARDEERTRAAEAGFQLHIAKPTRKQVVLSAVNSLLRFDAAVDRSPQV